MISLDTFLQIRHQFHNQHREIPRIAHNLDLDKRTIAKWAQQREYCPRKTGLRQSKLDSFKPKILKLLEEQGLSARHIYQLLRDDGYTGGYSILKAFVRHQHIDAPVSPKEFHAHRWMHRIMQDDIPLSELQNEFTGKLEPHEIATLTKHINVGRLRMRNKAVAILAFHRLISTRLISKYLLLDTRTVSKWRNRFWKGGIVSVFRFGSPSLKKSDQAQYREAVFSILHAPPTVYGFNRTSWRMEDIVQVLWPCGTDNPPFERCEAPLLYTTQALYPVRRC